MKQYYFTERGFAKLRQEIEDIQRLLKNEVAQEIATAASHGDLSENAEYDAAKAKQASLLNKLRAMEDRMAKGRVIRKQDLPEDIVTLGKVVTIQNVDDGEIDTYTILGDGESDIDKGIISYQSPLAQALMKHKEGDVVEVSLPRGTQGYKITKVKFFED